MKKAFKITFLVLLLGLIPVYFYPWGNSNDDKFIIDNSFHIKSFLIEQTNIHGENIDTTLYWDYDSIAIAIITDKYEDKETKVSSNYNLFNQTVFACYPPLILADENIEKISIISESEFEMKGEKPTNIGDTITNLFLWSDRNGIKFNSFGNNSNPFSISKGIIYLLKLKNGFDKNTDCKFDIKIQLSDESIHEFKDQVLKVK